MIFSKQEQYYCLHCRKLVNWVPYIDPKVYHVPVAICKECGKDICIPEEDWISGIREIVDEHIKDTKICREIYKDDKKHS